MLFVFLFMLFLVLFFMLHVFFVLLSFFTFHIFCFPFANRTLTLLFYEFSAFFTFLWKFF